MDINKQEAKKRIEKLKKEINHYRYVFHVEDREEISPAALDSLKSELFKLEMAFPDLITPDSPTQRVSGKPLEKFNKVVHSSPMISLFDAFSRQDMIDWEGRALKILGADKIPGGYFCELKLDGLAAALRYKRGLLAVGATRGDGQVGEDVTQNLKTIESIPLALRAPAADELRLAGFNDEQIKKIIKEATAGTIEVRGEAIMAKEVFHQLNKKYKKEGRPLLANPRNAAAGSIRQLDSTLVAERKLDFYVYAIATDLGLAKHEQELALAKLLGFKILKQNKFCRDLEEVFAFHDYWEKHKEELPMECDGVVVKMNDLSLWSRLGIVGKGPRYMIAYKFAAIQSTTKVKDVVWQVGRTGILTPTAVLEPVNVGGATVSHATLHNMDEIKRLNLKIGDTIIIERAGDVIPKVVQVLPKLRVGDEKAVKVPVKCPMCLSQVVKMPGEVAYRCANADCYAVNLRRLIHWTSKGAADIEGLGPKIIEQLVKEGLVSDIADFYSLKIGDLLPLERFAEKSAENLIKAIEEKKEIELARFIYGLGIRHIGEETALRIAEFVTGNWQFKISKIGDLINIFQKIKLAEWQKLKDLGPIVAKSIYDWWHDKRNIALLKKMERNGLKIKQSKTAVKKQILAGRTFVLTGGLESLTREEAKDKIKELGGSVSSSVSKNTDYVIVGAEPGSKYEKAKRLGVKIINEQQFLNLIK